MTHPLFPIPGRRSSPAPRPASIPCLVLALLVPACGPVEQAPGTPADGEGRAILVAVDALNEGILRETVPAGSVPTLLEVFQGASCAEHAVSHFPSVTAASLATLWTGAYGDVTGVPANSHHALPRDRHTVLEAVRGFGASGLRAEPLWVTGGRAGIPVAGHHVTQAPRVPGFPPVRSTGDGGASAERRAEAADALAHRGVSVMNGYNVLVDPHRALGPEDVDRVDSREWIGLDALDSDVEPRTFSWHTGAGMFHGVFFGRGDRYDRVLVNVEPRVEGGVQALAMAAESQPPAARDLARHFSGALAVPVEGGRVHLRVRLFHLTSDGRDFLLYQPSLHVVETNHPADQWAYEDAVRGWVGNSALSVYRDGGFGPSIFQGGDGLAEDRLLETAELMTRQFMRGSEWIWRERSPRLLADYFPLADEADHAFIGALDPRWPAFDPDVAARIEEVRGRMWALVDRRVAHLGELAREAGAALFVSGDHGMRATWRQFLPNAALVGAGLLVLDETGEVDLSRTRAISPNGYWISVNREAWREGIVPPHEEEGVVAAARGALEAARGPDGEPVVTRTFTPDEAPGMGLGGPAGGDLYWATAPGYRWSSGYTARSGDSVAVEASIWGSHGFPSDEEDMYTVFCAHGLAFPGVRTPPVRTTDVAPTVAEYVGLPRPRDAVGRSVLEELRGR